MRTGISNVLEELSLDDQDLVSWETVRNKKNENDVLYRLKFKEKRFAEEALRNAHTLKYCGLIYDRRGSTSRLTEVLNR